MRLFTLLLTVFVLLNASANDRLLATFYHPTGMPTASGTVIDVNKLNRMEIRYVALPRTMFVDMGGQYMLNDIIEVESNIPILNGEWIVKDKMGARHNSDRRIDFLLPKGHKVKFERPHVTIRLKHRPSKKKHNRR